MKTRCLACACEYEVGMGSYPEPCPSRYLSPHDQKFLDRVAELVGFNKKSSRDEHAKAIKEAWKEVGFAGF